MTNPLAQVPVDPATGFLLFAVAALATWLALEGLRLLFISLRRVALFCYGALTRKQRRRPAGSFVVDEIAAKALARAMRDSSTPRVILLRAGRADSADERSIF